MGGNKAYTIDGEKLQDSLTTLANRLNYSCIGQETKIELDEKDHHSLEVQVIQEGEVVEGIRGMNLKLKKNKKGKFTLTAYTHHERSFTKVLSLKKGWQAHATNGNNHGHISAKLNPFETEIQIRYTYQRY